MSTAPVVLTAPQTIRPYAPRYSFGTLVTRPADYATLRASLTAGGFTESDCEFLLIDNTGPHQTDAYAGLNALLNAARGDYVILCHQDVRLLSDNRATLDARLTELSARDGTWAVAGNAGGIAAGKLALRITDPHGANQRAGRFPQRVTTLDENLLIVRRAARVGFSHDLSGFHFYGADICLHADMMGAGAYVIDFHLQHLSPGNKSADFFAAEAAFKAKWSRALTPRWLQTTCTLMHLSAGPVRSALGHYIDTPIARVVRRLRGRTQRVAPTVSAP